MDRLVKADVKELNLIFTRAQKCSATFKLTNLMHTMSVAVSLTSSNPSLFTITPSLSIIPPLSAASFTLSQPSSDHPPLSSPPDSVLVRSSMLPTGKASQEELRQLFGRPGRYIFRDATIPISFVGPHVVEHLLTCPSFRTLETSFLLSNAISGCDQTQLTALLRTAVERNDSYSVSVLIEAGANLNSREIDGRSAMSLALHSGNLDVIRVLIDLGFKIDNSSDRFLHDSAEMNRADLLNLLCSAYPDIDLDSKNCQGQTALHIASIHGHTAVIQFLVLIGSKSEVADINGCTPLHYAAAEGHLEAVELLLTHSLYAKYAVTKDGKTAFDLAKQKGYSELYDMLQLGDELHKAARANDVNGLKDCLAQGAEVNGRDQNGWAALHRAAFKGQIDSVKVLVSHGAQVDLVDHAGCTALYLAAQAGHINVVCYLMAHGAGADNMNKSLKGVKVPFDVDCSNNHPSSLVIPFCRLSQTT